MSGPFAPVRTELDFPADEAKVLAFWKERKVFEQTLHASTRRTGPSKGTFVFYEGPPTANGMPHNGHVLTRAVKDIFPRYRTMQGFDVPRKAGWDTHGLPVEVEVEKELKIHGKADIEAYGVEPFTHRCIESVFRYTEAWERLTDKIGFWVDLKSAYVTFHRSYVESVWWALARLHDKGLLYRGHKIVWWWAQGGTALSAAEVGQGYKTVDDPSVYVAFPLVDEPDTALLVWTTTPWTLSSNMYAAVHPAYEYAVVEGETEKTAGRKLIVAKGLIEALSKKLGTELKVVRELSGKELVGKRYRPPFDTFEDLLAPVTRVHAVIAADFVLLDASGIVHIAPAFGEDDFHAHQEQLKADPDLPLLCAVQADGSFGERMGPRWKGRWVKDCDKELIADLRERGLLVHHETYRHEYPFCWRSDQDPLIQFARPAWYIQTTRENAAVLANNQAIHWLPEHIKEGRFGDFLRNNVDWALSRERYWGTPLPIWQNEALPEDHPRRYVAVESLEQLRARRANNVVEIEAALAAAIPDRERAAHLIVHKPWIDRVTFEEEGIEGTYRRVPEVIDGWFDSGCMPFAQHGFPHVEGSADHLRRAFPADFISEAIDQTRGWFYSLLMVSTLVFDEETRKKHGLSTDPTWPHPYKTCLVLGHVGDREGRKESKSKGNYTPPEVILDRVRMEFAALDAGEHGFAALTDGVAVIAREDYEGLDLTGDSTRVRVYRDGRDRESLTLSLRPTSGKEKLPRRVVALAAGDRQKLAVVVKEGAIGTPPNDVPRLPGEHKVWVEDPSAPAPGADAFRWFFYASSPSWTNTRHSLSNVRLEQKELAVKLRNVYSFFTIYANIDGFDPARGNASATDVEPETLARGEGYRPVADRPLLDRWVLGETAATVATVTRALDDYLLYDAARAVVDLVDSVSNWWLRRSRARFWAPGSASGAEATDKQDAYWTLYEVLVTLARVLAPFTPFFAEELWQNLVRNPWPTSQGESVHVVGWPAPHPARVDAELSSEMRAVREAVSLGLQVRTSARLKVRQPLARVDIVPGSRAAGDAVRRHAALVAEELNVKEVAVAEPGADRGLVDYQLKPNFRALGPKLGKKVQLAKQHLAKADAAAIRAELAQRGAVTLDLDGESFECTTEEIDVQITAREGYSAAGGRAFVVVVSTQLTDALRDEGLARELLSRVQQLRKELLLGFTQRVWLTLEGSDRLQRIAATHRELIFGESLAIDPPDPAAARDAATSRGKVSEVDVDGEAVTIVMVSAS